MIICTGDIHGMLDVKKIDRMDKILQSGDFLILLGDTGFLWYGDERDIALIRYFKKKPYTVLSILGNHENFYNIRSIAGVQRWGGLTRRIEDNIYYLENGEIFNIDGQTIAVMGGGYSIDKARRTEGLTWWAEEQPSEREMQQMRERLKKVDYKVDYLLTHSATHDIMVKQFPMSWQMSDTPLCHFLSELHDTVEFKHHYFGHLHLDEGYDKATTIFDNFIELK